MRPMLAVVVVAAVLGMVKAYTIFQASLPKVAAERLVREQVAGDYSIELTLTFDAMPDEFSFEPVSLMVKQDGHDKPLLKRTDKVEANAPVVIDRVETFLEGTNEFTVEAFPGAEDIDRPHAVRVRVLRGNRIIVEKSLWSRGGEPINDVVAFDIAEASDSTPAHAHE